MEPKISSDVKYDDRRKEMTHTTTEVREAKMKDTLIGEVSIQSKGIYNEEGIKRILKDLEAREKQLQKVVDSAEKKELKEVPELADDLKELKEKLIKLQERDQIEKENVEAKAKNDQIEANQKDLDQVKKDLRDIKETIGSRLKL